MVIHDLAGFGRAALTVVIPILSRMGIQACPLPTAVFSTHGALPGHTSVELTSFLRACLQHWTDLAIDFDAVYSGFLGRIEQVDILTDYLKQSFSPDRMVMIDPVLGDSGTLYGVTDPRMVEAMRSYIGFADLITPNLTEAALLLDAAYEPNPTENTLKSWCIRLGEMGPNIVAITHVSVSASPNQIAVLAYEREQEQFWTLPGEKFPVSFPGTGDAFTSVLLGRLLRGDSLPGAVQQAMQFVAHAIRTTLDHATPIKEGILLECVLDALP
jgi:pyridoxine kinase